jgi:hypothetical protein
MPGRNERVSDSRIEREARKGTNGKRKGKKEHKKNVETRKKGREGKKKRRKVKKEGQVGEGKKDNNERHKGSVMFTVTDRIE